MMSSNFIFTHIFNTDLSANKAFYKELFNSIEYTGKNISFAVNRFNSLGNEIPGENSIPGDLNIFINELPHKTFNREGNDLVTIINVSVIDAILGCKMPINTINNKKVVVTIPRGSEEGKHIIINGYGLPIYGSNMFGNLICVIHIVMPKNITNKEVKKLEELRKSESFKKLSGNG